jgi:hypothetical protein
MTASSSVVLSNLAYLIGAVVFAVLGGVVVWWRHRTPKSVQANISSFSRGLRALAPEGEDGGTVHQPGIEPRPGGVRIVQPVMGEPMIHDRGRQAEG